MCSNELDALGRVRIGVHELSGQLVQVELVLVAAEQRLDLAQTLHDGRLELGLSDELLGERAHEHVVVVLGELLVDEYEEDGIDEGARETRVAVLDAALGHAVEVARGHLGELDARVDDVYGHLLDGQLARHAARDQLVEQVVAQVGVDALERVVGGLRRVAARLQPIHLLHVELNELESAALHLHHGRVEHERAERAVEVAQRLEVGQQALVVRLRLGDQLVQHLDLLLVVVATQQIVQVLLGADGLRIITVIVAVVAVAVVVVVR